LLTSPDLRGILLYHVVSGTAMSSDLEDGQKLKTVQGGELDVAVRDGTVTVGGAAVSAADVTCANGVIHVIDSVLLPPAGSSPAAIAGESDGAGCRGLRDSEIKHGRVAMMAALGGVA
ncbi:MAG: fasciclin domain-containing protein, partial [Candidatus Fonsibacter sp.]